MNSVRITLMAGLALSGMAACVPANAQTEKIPVNPLAEKYQSNLYRSSKPEPLDKNYGMPTRATAGGDMPQQKTMATPDAGVPPEPDFYKGMSGGDAIAAPDGTTTSVPDFYDGLPDFDLPKAKQSGSTASSSDTPLYTTTDGTAPDAALSDGGMGDETSQDDTLTK